MSKYSSEEINHRNEISLKMFDQLEGYLNDFLSYVPLDELHLNVYSLKLATIILEAGPEIMSAFDIAIAICEINPLAEWFNDTPRDGLERLRFEERERRARNQSLTFGHYYEFLNSHDDLRVDVAKVGIEYLKAYLMPFERNHAEWWNTYNLLKHERYDNFKKATLKMTLELLGSLFWLVDRNTRWIHYRERCQSHLFKVIDDSIIEASLKKL